MDPKRDVCIITGANTGIGRATAVEMARRGARVLIACRSEVKGREAVGLVKSESGSAAVDFLELDLASLASVRRAAAGFLALDVPLPLLINNAGMAGQRGLTADGFELPFRDPWTGLEADIKTLSVYLSEPISVREVQVKPGLAAPFVQGWLIFGLRGETARVPLSLAWDSAANAPADNDIDREQLGAKWAALPAWVRDALGPQIRAQRG